MEKKKGKSLKPPLISYSGILVQWRTVYLGGEPTKYQVSNLGQVCNRKRNYAILATILDKDGYVQVCLSHKGKKYVCHMHRLVAEAFIPNPDNKPEVNHCDGIKYNNCVDNLAWATTKENINHAFQMGLHRNDAIGSRHGMNQYSEDSIRHVCKLLEECKTPIYKIAEMTGVSKATIHDIIGKKYWTHISKDYKIENFSSKLVKGINLEMKSEIMKLASSGKTLREICAILGLDSSHRMYPCAAHYTKQYRLKHNALQPKASTTRES